jgi:glycerophosphoryl diester phosphodiesterase
MEDKLVAALDAHEYTKHAPVIVQSFEIGNLKYLHDKLGGAHPNVALVQLLDEPGKRPGDVLAAGGKLAYADMLTPEGLREIAAYAQYLGPYKAQIIPVAGDALGRPTSLVRDAHAAGLKVIPYTFRPENYFLPKAGWKGEDPRGFNEAGSVAEIRAFLDAGIDGFFTDMPLVGRVAVDGWKTTREGD